jgi:hypothetical protein
MVETKTTVTRVSTHSWRKLAIGTGLSIGIVVVVGGGIWYWMGTARKPAVAKAQFNNDYSQNARLLSTGKYAQNEQSLKDYLQNKQLTNQQRHDVLFQLGITYYLDKKKDLAKSSLLEATQAGGSTTASLTYATLAGLYKDSGDKAQAATYYRKAIARAQKTPEVTDDTNVGAYQQMIRDLGEQP